MFDVDCYTCSQLSEVAIEDNVPVIAERCYAALGDVAKRRFLHKINKLAAATMEEEGGGMAHHMVRAKMHMLNKQFQQAEQVLLEPLP